jgi:hypothetical protein
MINKRLFKTVLPSKFVLSDFSPSPFFHPSPPSSEKIAMTTSSLLARLNHLV